MTTYEVTFNERTAIGKNLLAFFEENKKYVKVKDPTKMTKEEFYAKIERSAEQARQGRVRRIKYEDIDKFLGIEQ